MRPDHVDRNRELQAVVGHRPLARQDPGVVHQHVDALVRQLVDEGVHRLAARQVDPSNLERFVAGGRDDLFAHLRCLLDVPARHHHRRAALGQALGGRSPQPAVGPRHHAHSAGQIDVHLRRVERVGVPLPAGAVERSHHGRVEQPIT